MPPRRKPEATLPAETLPLLLSPREEALQTEIDRLSAELAVTKEHLEKACSSNLQESVAQEEIKTFEKITKDLLEKAAEDKIIIKDLEAENARLESEVEVAGNHYHEYTESESGPFCFRVCSSCGRHEQSLHVEGMPPWPYRSMDNTLGV